MNLPIEAITFFQIIGHAMSDGDQRRGAAQDGLFNPGEALAFIRRCDLGENFMRFVEQRNIGTLFDQRMGDLEMPRHDERRSATLPAFLLEPAAQTAEKQPVRVNRQPGKRRGQAARKRHELEATRRFHAVRGQRIGHVFGRHIGQRHRHRSLRERRHRVRHLNAARARQRQRLGEYIEDIHRFTGTAAEVIVTREYSRCMRHIALARRQILPEQVFHLWPNRHHRDFRHRRLTTARDGINPGVVHRSEKGLPLGRESAAGMVAMIKRDHRDAQSTGEMGGSGVYADIKIQVLHHRRRPAQIKTSGHAGDATGQLGFKPSGLAATFLSTQYQNVSVRIAIKDTRAKLGKILHGPVTIGLGRKAGNLESDEGMGIGWNIP